MTPGSGPARSALGSLAASVPSHAGAGATSDASNVITLPVRVPGRHERQHRVRDIGAHHHPPAAGGENSAATAAPGAH
jgi:hypothetical protein